MLHSGLTLDGFEDILDQEIQWSEAVVRPISLEWTLLVVGESRFKDSAESETSRPSRIRLGPLRDESESRVGRLNSEETD